MWLTFYSDLFDCTVNVKRAGENMLCKNWVGYFLKCHFIAKGLEWVDVFGFFLIFNFLWYSSIVTAQAQWAKQRTQDLK